MYEILILLYASAGPHTAAAVFGNRNSTLEGSERGGGDQFFPPFFFVEGCSATQRRPHLIYRRNSEIYTHTTGFTVPGTSYVIYSARAANAWTTE